MKDLFYKREVKTVVKCALSNAIHAMLTGEDGVVWDFTEIGKGKLTTNNHINDYDFIWSLEDGKLKIETDWLYNLENEYEYALDQNAKTLTLTSGEDVYRFTAE